jgi:hypothetical protein
MRKVVAAAVAQGSIGTNLQAVAPDALGPLLHQRTGLTHIRRALTHHSGALSPTVSMWELNSQVRTCFCGMVSRESSDSATTMWRLPGRFRLLGCAGLSGSSSSEGGLQHRYWEFQIHQTSRHLLRRPASPAACMHWSCLARSCKQEQDPRDKE